MKTNYLSLKTFVLLIACASCTSDFIDLKPESDMSIANFYKTAADAVVGVNSAYDILQSGNQYGSLFYRLMEIRSDNALDLNPGANAGVNYRVDVFDEEVTNSNLSSAYLSLYAGIYRCNIVLDKIDDISMDESLSNRLKGELYFIRGLSYFNLVRLWGGVPLVQHAASPDVVQQLGRSSEAEVYIAIENDLKFSVDNLLSSYTGSDIGRATSDAAKTLLAKVYLYQQKWTETRSLLQTVVMSDDYSLLDDPAEVFNVNNKDNEEVIFAIKYGVAGQEGHGMWLSSTTQEGGRTVVDTSLANAYADVDKRKPLVGTVAFSNNSLFAPLKVYAPLATNQTINDFILLRYADALLMLAEAECEIAQTPNTAAIGQLNAVRNRAGLTPLTPTDVPTLQQLREAIYQERRLELALECDRWFDMVRISKIPGNEGYAERAIAASEARTLAGTRVSIQQRDYIYPLPDSEVQLYNNPETFPQNPGYPR